MCSRCKDAPTQTLPECPSCGSYHCPSCQSHGPEDDNEAPRWFENFYRCPCGAEWSDEWDATCDDRCPNCNTACSPYESQDLTKE